MEPSPESQQGSLGLCSGAWQCGRLIKPTNSSYLWCFIFQLGVLEFCLGR